MAAAPEEEEGPLPEAEMLTGDFAFRRVGDVCCHAEAELLALDAAPGNAQLAAASSVHGLVFFADAKGARALHARICECARRGVAAAR